MSSFEEDALEAVVPGKCPVAHRGSTEAALSKSMHTLNPVRIMDAVDRPSITAYQLYDQPLEISQASATRDWMRDGEERKAMRCLPLRMASQQGWIIRNSHRLVVIWSGEKSPAAVNILYHPERPQHLLARSFLGDGILTFQLPYLFRTSPGYNLLIRGPANCPKDGISPLEALVETDWLEASFLMSWQITRPRTPIVFEVGEPLCMIVPQRRGEVESFDARLRPLDENEELSGGFAAWRQSRNDFNARRRVQGSSVGWQMHYAHGLNVSGNPGSDHQTRLNLARFEPVPATIEDDVA